MHAQDDDLQADLYAEYVQAMDNDFGSQSPQEVRQSFLERVAHDVEVRDLVGRQLVLFECKNVTIDTIVSLADASFGDLATEWEQCYNALTRRWYDPRDGPSARHDAKRRARDAILRCADRLGPLDVVVPRELPEHTYLDGDLSLAMIADGRPIAISGISYGLTKYYDRPDYKELDDVKALEDVTPELGKRLDTLIDAVRGKWVITQMQGISGTTQDRQRRNFRRQLLAAWDIVAEELAEPIDLYIPGEVTYWNLPPVRHVRAENGYRTPEQRVLLMNYDYTAKRNGFRYNPATSLYERNGAHGIAATPTATRCEGR